MFQRKGPRQAQGALADFYAVASPRGSTPLTDLPLLAVDIETTGLDPATDRVLSMGWVPVNGRQIDLAGAGYYLINTDGAASVGNSATIHGLTDEQLAQGVAPEEALAALLTALQGRAMLVHFAPIERDFLSALSRKHFGSGLKVPIVDTLALERRHMEKMGTYPRGEDLRLPRVRERYNLPHYGAHNALNDSLACAELYLAITEHGKANTLGALTHV